MIELQDVGKVYHTSDGDNRALEHVSLTINDGDVFGIIGESGAGKSTLVRLLNLLERPTEGRIIVDGTDITDYQGRELRGLRESMGMIFQDFNLFQQRSVLRNVMFPLEVRHEPRAASEERARELLRLVGLEGLEDRYPSQLSGGQQQRVMIAMALAAEPDLLIADEPTTALDVTTQKEVLDLIDRIADERSMAVLLITHNLGLVAEHSREMNVMYAGEIVERGHVADVLGNPRHPYTKGLIAAVPRLDAPKDAPLSDIPGTVPPPWDWPSGCAFHPRCPYAKPACADPSFTRCPCL